MQKKTNPCLHCHLGEALIAWFEDQGIDVNLNLSDRGVALALNGLALCVADTISGFPIEQRDTAMNGFYDGVKFHEERKRAACGQMGRAAPGGATKH
jgi:hypothetical protein